MRSDDRAEHAELRHEVDRAIGDLPIDHRAALVLRDIEGLSTAQAAAVLGLREGAFAVLNVGLLLALPRRTAR